MSIRKDPIYVSNEVYGWLRLLAKADNVGMEGLPHPRTTADEIADQLLRQAIREAHPQLAEHRKEIEKLEEKLLEALQKK